MTAAYGVYFRLEIRVLLMIIMSLLGDKKTSSPFRGQHRGYRHAGSKSKASCPSTCQVTHLDEGGYLPIDRVACSLEALAMYCVQEPNASKR